MSNESDCFPVCRSVLLAGLIRFEQGPGADFNLPARESKQKEWVRGARRCAKLYLWPVLV